MNKYTIIHLRIDTESMEIVRKISVMNYRSINNQILLMIHEYIKQNKHETINSFDSFMKNNEE
jgi:hypothetical protein